MISLRKLGAVIAIAIVFTSAPIKIKAPTKIKQSQCKICLQRSLKLLSACVDDISLLVPNTSCLFACRLEQKEAYRSVCAVCSLSWSILDNFNKTATR